MEAATAVDGPDDVERGGGGDDGGGDDAKEDALEAPEIVDAMTLASEADAAGDFAWWIHDKLNAKNSARAPTPTPVGSPPERSPSAPTTPPPPGVLTPPHRRRSMTVVAAAVAANRPAPPPPPTPTPTTRPTRPPRPPRPRAAAVVDDDDRELRVAAERRRAIHAAIARGISGLASDADAHRAKVVKFERDVARNRLDAFTSEIRREIAATDAKIASLLESYRARVARLDDDIFTERARLRATQDAITLERLNPEKSSIETGASADIAKLLADANAIMNRVASFTVSRDALTWALAREDAEADADGGNDGCPVIRDLRSKRVALEKETRGPVAKALEVAVLVKEAAMRSVERDRAAAAAAATAAAPTPTRGARGRSRPGSGSSPSSSSPSASTRRRSTLEDVFGREFGSVTASSRWERSRVGILAKTKNRGGSGGGNESPRSPVTPAESSVATSSSGIPSSRGTAATTSTSSSSDDATLRVVVETPSEIVAAASTPRSSSASKPRNLWKHGRGELLPKVLTWNGIPVATPTPPRAGSAARGARASSKVSPLPPGKEEEDADAAAGSAKAKKKVKAAARVAGAAASASASANDDGAKSKSCVVM